MKSNKLHKLIMLAIFLITAVVTIVCVFYGFLPERYDLNIGSVSISNIYASRNFVDNYQTEYDATIAENQVEPIFIRSERISTENNEKVASFFELVRTSRSAMVDDLGFPVENTTAVVNALISSVGEQFDFVLRDSQARTLLNMSSSAFLYLEDEATSITEVLMLDQQTAEIIDQSITDAIISVSSNFSSFPEYRTIATDLLGKLIEPNSVFDTEATQEAAENAYISTMNDPVIVERGTKILGEGQVVDEHVYQLLVDLELVRDTSFDYIILARVVAYVAVIFSMVFMYIKFSRKKMFEDIRITAAFAITFLIPIAISIYTNEISTLAIAVLFFTVLSSTYLGVSAGIVLSLANLLLMWPVFNFDAEVLFINCVAIFICAALASNSGKKGNSASIILFTTLGAILASLAYNFLMSSTRTEFVDSLVWTTISTAISVVSAIGLMPIFELISDAVSPVRLIELSKPGQPLLKRLFLEAPGTSQHSIMVSNLADSAAEAIGCDALFCKVAAYYHDVGKLMNPFYFTENITDENPHENLPVLESVRIITSHVIDGVKIARKYGLPPAIIDIILEHHGTTAPMFFYHKAKEQAAAQGLPEPSIDDFRYPGKVPSTKESAIIMLADSCEAAVKSLNTTNVDEVETMIRKVIKQKVDNDQLVKTDLSFNELETIVYAFRHVYFGLYHERIKYPE